MPAFQIRPFYENTRIKNGLGFGGQVTEAKKNTKPKSRRESVSYEDKLADCGSSSNLFRIEQVLMPDDSIQETRYWSARVGIASDTFSKIDAFYEEGSRRASIHVLNQSEAIEAVSKAAGRDVQVMAIAKSEGVPNTHV